MAKRRCKFGKKADGKCRKTPRSGNLGGVSKTCTRYALVPLRRKHGGRRMVMRCVDYVDASGCPPHRGQRKGFAECTTRNTSRTGYLRTGVARSYGR